MDIFLCMAKIELRGWYLSAEYPLAQKPQLAVSPFENVR